MYKYTVCVQFLWLFDSSKTVLRFNQKWSLQQYLLKKQFQYSRKQNLSLLVEVVGLYVSLWGEGLIFLEQTNEPTRKFEDIKYSKKISICKNPSVLFLYMNIVFLEMYARDKFCSITKPTKVVYQNSYYNSYCNSSNVHTYFEQSLHLLLYLLIYISPQ